MNKFHGTTKQDIEVRTTCNYHTNTWEMYIKIANKEIVPDLQQPLSSLIKHPCFACKPFEWSTHLNPQEQEVTLSNILHI